MSDDMNYFILNPYMWFKAMKSELDRQNKAKQEGLVELSEEPKRDTLASAQFVRKFLSELPKDLRKMFTPRTPEEIEELEMRLMKFPKFEDSRQRIINLQRQYGLPIRPNMTLSQTLVRIRIEQLRYKKKMEYDEGIYRDPDSDESMGGAQ